jgi:hypothetical protein
MRLSLPRIFRRPSPELLFGLFQGLLWLFLALQVTTGVVTPLAASLGALLPQAAVVE